MATNFRTAVNRPGVTYQEEDTKTLYAEDFNAHSQAINALENKKCAVLTVDGISAPTNYADLATPAGSGIFRVSYVLYSNPANAASGTVRLKIFGYTTLFFHEVVSETLSLASLSRVSGTLVVLRDDLPIRWKIEQVSGSFGTARANLRLVLEKIS